MSYRLLTCEHAVNFIPDEYSDILNIPDHVLESHMGYDMGASRLCKFLSDALGCTSIFGKCSRLLVDLNRSRSSKNLFSKYSQKLALIQKQNILKNYYLPYREEIESFVADQAKRHEKVIHFSIHSFTPVLNNKIRNADIGLLYDPGRLLEVQMASEMKNNLKSLSKNFSLIIRKNYPYRGITDGMVSYLRKKYKEPDYVGFELEINQHIFKEQKKYQELKVNLLNIIKSLTLKI